MACGGFTCSKNALAALNVLYILVAFILIGVAAYGKAVAIITNIGLMGGIIACGVFLLFIAIIGLIGAVKHNQVLLFFYMIILFLIFLVQFAVACACLAMNADQQEQLARNGWNLAPDTLKNKTQILMDCCGFEEDSQDHFNDTATGHPPCGAGDGSHLSCCLGLPISTAPCCTGISEPPSNETCTCATCLAQMQGPMNQATKSAGGVGLFFSFTEIFGVWLTVRFRNQKDPRANPSAFL